MRRNTALSLRFPLLVYEKVNSRQESRACLVLLASSHFKNFKNK